MVCLSLARAKEKATTGLAPLFDAFGEDAAFLYGIFLFLHGGARMSKRLFRWDIARVCRSLGAGVEKGRSRDG